MKTPLTCGIQFTQREINLLLKYAYLFPEEAQMLRTSQTENGYHQVRIDSCWISMWIGELVISAKKIRNRAMLEELDELCSVLENAEHHNERIRVVPFD